jgi:hypothetical protein
MDEHLLERSLKNIKTIFYDSSKFKNDLDIPILKLEKNYQIIGILSSFNILGNNRKIEIKISDKIFIFNFYEGNEEDKFLPILYNHVQFSKDSEILSICKKNFADNDKLKLKIFVFN